MTMKSRLFERILQENNAAEAAAIIVSSLEKHKEVLDDRDIHKKAFVELIENILSSSREAVVDVFKNFHKTQDLTGSTNYGLEIARSLLNEICNRIEVLIDQKSVFWSKKDFYNAQSIAQIAKENPPVDYVVELGNFIDGLNKDRSNKEDELQASADRLDWAIKHGYEMAM